MTEKNQTAPHERILAGWDVRLGRFFVIKIFMRLIATFLN